MCQFFGCTMGTFRCGLGSKPKSNRSFWNNKIKHNKLRDSRNDRKIRQLGYKLLVIRECLIRKGAHKIIIQKKFFKDFAIALANRTGTAFPTW